MKLAERGITLKSYVLGLIEKDLRHTEQEVDVEAIRAAAAKAQDNLLEILSLTET